MTAEEEPNSLLKGEAPHRRFATLLDALLSREDISGHVVTSLLEEAAVAAGWDRDVGTDQRKKADARSVGNEWDLLGRLDMLRAHAIRKEMEDKDCIR